jgi:hypothetical protein
MRNFKVEAEIAALHGVRGPNAVCSALELKVRVYDFDSIQRDAYSERETNINATVGATPQKSTRQKNDARAESQNSVQHETITQGCG